MTYQQQQFLNQFDQPIRNYIIEYCKRLSDKNYDVYILLARKAACFMSVLESLGFVSLNGDVVSDRIQEFNPDWLKGKRIAIIDDTIISGTTISRLINKMESFHVADISVHTFCIDSYWFRNKMLQREGHDYLVQPYMILEHPLCIRFCKQIVNALSIIPRPYNIDFPTYEISKLTQLNYQDILSDSNWKIVNTTTYLQSQNNVSCFSLNFNRNLLELFFDSLGCNFRNTQFVKVRIFTKKLIDNKTTRYLSRVVPYVIFDEIDLPTIDKIISSICISEGKDGNYLESELVTESSKMIFLQYYFSNRLMKWWISYTEKLLGKKMNCNIIKRSLSLLFSPSVISAIIDFTYDKHIELDSETSVKINKNPLISYGHSLTSKKGINPLRIREHFTKAFLDLYYKKELPARRKALLEESVSLNDKKMHRLDQGESMIKLKKLIAGYVFNSTDANLLLSTFLDNAIDAGIAVPITVYDKNKSVVYRGFRHGEEVVWGNANDKLTALFFETIFGEHGIVSKLQFEKLLVLFVKLGLSLKVLDEYNFAVLPNDLMVKIVCIRSYLYGQITTTHFTSPVEKLQINPILDPEETSQWTTDQYQNNNIIKSVKDGYELHFENLPCKQFDNEKVENETDDIDSSAIDEVEIMAEVFKTCHDQGQLDDDTLVLLTSCVSILDNVSSVCAELQLFISSADHLIKKINSVVINQELATADFLSDLRNPKKNISWTALNSGKYKFISFRNGSGINRKNEIRDVLKKNKKDKIYASLWDKYWKIFQELSVPKDDELKSLSSASGRILIDLLNVNTCIHILLYEYIHRKSFKRLSSSKYIDDSEDIIKSGKSALTDEEIGYLKSSDLVSLIQSRGYRYLSVLDLFDYIDIAVKTLGDLKRDAENLLSDYSVIVPSFGKDQKPTNYNSLIHIKSLSDDNMIRLNSLVNNVITKVENEEFNGHNKNKSLMILETKDVIQNADIGILIGGKGEWYLERMVKLAGHLLLTSEKWGLSTIITFIPSFGENGLRAYFNEKNQKTNLLKKEIFSKLPLNEEVNCINIYTDRIIYDFNKILCKVGLKDRLNVIEDSNVLTNLKYKVIQKRTKKIFLSYSNKDIDYKDGLINYLQVNPEIEIIHKWSCEDITELTWNDEMKKELVESDLVLFMLSADYFKSNYLLKHEVLNVITNNRKYLCVVVKELGDIDHIKKSIFKCLNLSIDQCKVFDFECSPITYVKKNLNIGNERKLVPLVNFENITGNNITSAFNIISEDVSKILFTPPLKQ